mgnify:CR=1 FL=1
MLKKFDRNKSGVRSFTRDLLVECLDAAGPRKDVLVTCADGEVAFNRKLDTTMKCNLNSGVYMYILVLNVI